MAEEGRVLKTTL